MKTTCTWQNTETNLLNKEHERSVSWSLFYWSIAAEVLFANEIIP